MRKLSLFSGIGGIDLAAHWAGMETVAFCEREPFPQAVLRKHWPDVPIYDDVCTLTADRLKEDEVIGDGRTIDIISAGYPCQPFSVAGDRKGEEDDRHLWPEVSRLLQEIRPTWFVGENVAGHITLGLDDVLSDLACNSYAAQAFVIPAVAVNAPHRRDRVFIVAYADGGGLEEPAKRYTEIESLYNQASNTPDPFADVKRLYGSRDDQHIRRGNGIPNTMDRFKSLGNAVNPYQIYPILAAIKAINDSL